MCYFMKIKLVAIEWKLKLCSITKKQKIFFPRLCPSSPASSLPPSSVSTPAMSHYALLSEPAALLFMSAPSLVVISFKKSFLTRMC